MPLLTKEIQSGFQFIALGPQHHLLNVHIVDDCSKELIPAKHKINKSYIIYIYTVNVMFFHIFSSLSLPYMAPSSHYLHYKLKVLALTFALFFAVFSFFLLFVLSQHLRLNRTKACVCTIFTKITS